MRRPCYFTAAVLLAVTMSSARAGEAATVCSKSPFHVGSGPVQCLYLRQRSLLEPSSRVLHRFKFHERTVRYHGGAGLLGADTTRRPAGRGVRRMPAKGLSVRDRQAIMHRPDRHGEEREKNPRFRERSFLVAGDVDGARTHDLRRDRAAL